LVQPVYAIEEVGVERAPASVEPDRQLAVVIDLGDPVNDVEQAHLFQIPRGVNQRHGADVFRLDLDIAAVRAGQWRQFERFDGRPPGDKSFESDLDLRIKTFARRRVVAYVLDRVARGECELLVGNINGVGGAARVAAGDNEFDHFAVDRDVGHVPA